MGGANSNTSDHKIVVQDLAALSQVIVAPLDEGTEATVVSEGDARYVLHKSGGLAQSLPFIVVPVAGSPSAGAAGAYWQKEFECGLQQTNSAKQLSEDITTQSTTFEPMGDLSIPITTAPAPEGGVLIVDFSAVIRLDPGSSELDPQAPNPQAEVNVGIFLNSPSFQAPVLLALASFNALHSPTGLEVTPEEPIETVAMTLRIPTTDLNPPLAQGNYTVFAQWKVNGATATSTTVAACLASTKGITAVNQNDQRFYACLRVMEVSC